MERRAQLLLVSAFLLFSLGGLIWFMSWISPSADARAREYLVQFESSVSGLSQGSEVRYLGVPVGRVEKISLNPDMAGRVDVLLAVDETLPPVEELMALLEPQGITGLALIELRERGAEPVIEVEAGIIPGQASMLSRVSDAAVQVAQSTETAMARINEFLNEQTVEDMKVTVSQLRTLSTNLATASGELDALMARLSRASAEIETALPTYRELAVSVQKQVIPSVIATSESLQETSAVLGQTLKQSQPEIENLLQQDVPSLVGLADDLALTLQELQQLLENVNNEPGALLYGAPVTEVEIPND